MKQRNKIKSLIWSIILSAEIIGIFISCYYEIVILMFILMFIGSVIAFYKTFTMFEEDENIYSIESDD